MYRKEGRSRLGCELGLERVGVEALVVHRQRDDLDTLAREDLQRAVVARRLDEHSPGRARELLRRVEDEALKPADRENDARRLDAVACGDPLA